MGEGYFPITQYLVPSPPPNKTSKIALNYLSFFLKNFLPLKLRCLVIL